MTRGMAAALAAMILAAPGPAAAAESTTAGPVAPASEHATETDIREARALAQRFFKALKTELQAAMAEGGAIHAIEVCRTVAPGIAGELSMDSGWAVGRTSMRVRNPRNAPSVRERGVLMDFLRRAEAGEDLAGMESAAVVSHGAQRYLHYMKAIPTAGICLTCHGDSLSPDLKQAIAASYPADSATGFALGDLRGAFTFVKPLPDDGAP